MSCEMFREALSARLDGEPELVSPDVVDRHLETCSACRSWQARAHVLRRTLVVRAAPVVPDLSETILARIPAPSTGRWPARIALGIVAFAQLTLALGQLLGVASGMAGMSEGGFMPQHLGHESSAWNLAVGVGLLCAALLPRMASGQLPVMAGFVLVLTVVSATDLAAGTVTGARLATHVFAVLGAALLFVVQRQYRRDHPPQPVADDAPDADWSVAAGSAGGGEFSRGGKRSRLRRRPASRHRAA
ncbi:zf-HC2 domain-containing protein [Amycolatopsis pigmentata]|uniref:Zf-HC2 domain-containing protein n=1 Tax=Amycolatopsis pigmentata TaxID=450801 RepID=A0ABW5FIV8_9PSEU